ncbi:hypothetical protein Acel_1021 [Acidothermus cellulolyticus 11B]|uniref:Hydrogenase maturation nickel metallochaperone HypA n=1 Tax=Acidothermus cellulolyticus (strain ATCC 43068 / DSM 8971 / 11B) TaxID=351607 RepID=A0LTN4_ACIC1|nr:hydrogenase maturation nickel metallochaperone HypA [Acidothermus cellulolyticus]ABK52794.1 hypothetical protein Acel_1021 [Acidothermus cellulolyticus 11B]
MHERALIADLLRVVEEHARRVGATRVHRIRVRVGPFAHVTPESVREQFRFAAAGSIAAQADVDVVTGSTDSRGDGVLLESIEVDGGSSGEGACA